MKLIQKLSRKRGFTLIELIMTIIVVGIVSVSISIAISQHIESVFEAENLTIATNLARFEMEKVNNLDYDSISSLTTNDYEGYDYDVVRTVSYEYGSAASAEALKKVTVEVKKSGSSNTIVTLTTYFSKNVILGI